MYRVVAGLKKCSKILKLCKSKGKGILVASFHTGVMLISDFLDSKNYVSMSDLGLNSNLIIQELPETFFISVFSFNKEEQEYLTVF